MDLFPKNLRERIFREEKAHTEKDILAISHNLKAKFPHVLKYPSRNRLFETIDKIMSCIDGKIILDYGCGRGNDCLKYLSRGAVCYGIDISKDYINAAKNAAIKKGYPRDRYSFQVMDAHKLEFKKDKFDIVIGHGVLHHLDPSTAFDEVFRVLKPGGRALFQEPLADNWLLKFFRFFTPHARTKDEKPFSGKDIKRFISQNRWKSEVVYCGLVEAPLSIFTSLVLPKRPDNAIIKLADRIDRFTHRNHILLSWNQYILLNFVKK
jgi:ubiquinone/menaquinone biosynthesis C-methylase UbiE